MADEKQRVFIVDDDSSVRTSLARLLESAGYTTESYSSAKIFLERLPFDGIACLILDVRMPGMSGIELHKQLNRKGNVLPVIFLTAHGDLSMGIESMKRGAKDFLQKPVDEIDLLNAVNKILFEFQSVYKNNIAKTKASYSIDTLTPRELEMLQFILGGATNKQIADHTHISEKTVKAHRGKIMKKTGASSAAELGWVCSSLRLAAKRI